MEVNLNLFLFFLKKKHECMFRLALFHFVPLNFSLLSLRSCIILCFSAPSPPVCLSTVTRTWCSLTTWPCVLAPAWWEGLATMMSSPCSLRSTPWWRASSSSMKASSPARAKYRDRCMRNAWRWSRMTGERKDVHTHNMSTMRGGTIIWGCCFFVCFFSSQRAYHWGRRCGSRLHP